MASLEMPSSEAASDTSRASMELRVIGTAASHDVLLRVLGTKQPCKILDVPAGEGVFCAFLRNKGWDVHAADIDPGNFRLSDVPFTRVNLNRRLPFADSSFDAVSCVNGLHRLIAPEVAIGEFARIIRPGGRLYVNINNYSSIWKRLRFLMVGSIDEAIESQYCIQTIDDPEANVRIPLLYPRLNAMLLNSGFTIVDVRSAAVSTRDRVLAPLAWLVAALSRVLPRDARAKLAIEEANALPIVAGGAYAFVEAAKSDR
jgi:SAM-dependent methyltransferase